MSSVLGQMPISSGLMSKLLRFFNASQSLLSTLITLIFICLSAWLGGQMFWGLYDNQVQVPKWLPGQVDNAPSHNRSNGYDVSALLDAALFGRLSKEAKPVSVAPVTQNAPQTRLKLILVGAVSSSKPEKSLAIIANRGTQATYGIGEQIEGTQAKLINVFADRVIIDNAGRDETVMLAGVDYKKTTQQQNSPSGNTSLRPEQETDISEQIQAIRDEIQQDSQQVFQYIGLSQAKVDDRVVGYKVRPGKKRELFDAVGLKNGDIAIALNGEDLTDPAVMGKIVTTISEMTELNLTVERNGQIHEIYIEL